VESERNIGTTTRSVNLQDVELSLPDRTREIIANLRSMEISLPMVAEIVKALHLALLVELTTIPAYLSAMWSINAPQLEEFNQESGNDVETMWNLEQLLKGVFIQEMLHAHIVCNTIAGLGFEIDFLKCFPSFPTLLPHAHREIMVNLHPLTEENVRIFADIESPAEPCEEDLNTRPDDISYESIGEFYMYLMDKIDELQVDMNTDRQLGTLYPNYSLLMEDIPSVIRHLNIIIEQGEGPIGDSSSTTNHYQAFLKMADAMAGGKLDNFVIPASGNWTKGVLHDPDFHNSPHVARLRKKLDAFNAVYTYLFYCFDGIWNHYPDNENDRVEWRATRSRWVLSMRAVMAQTLPIIARDIFTIKVPVVQGDNVYYMVPAATFERYTFHDGSIVEQIQQLIDAAEVEVVLGNLQDRILHNQ